MKKIFIIPLLLSALFVSSQESGWRPGEMEVRVNGLDNVQRQLLHEMRLNGDFYQDGTALLYLVPDEFKKLTSTQIHYEILKEDLNEYYRDFWNSREEYHSYEEIIQVMNSLAFGYSGICAKHNYGTSLGGRQLTALKISDNVTVDETEPEVGFDGSIHGDEIGGAENLIRFAEFLCESYGNDPDITDLIDNREIWLYVMVNPDGRANMSRYNNNGVDLNRDWGYMWDAWGNSPGYYSQPETKALRNWLYGNQFVVHTSYHSGTEELVYPWSYRPDPSPDDAHIDDLAVVYVSTSGYPNLAYGQGYSGLYPINGSSKDSYYGVMGSVGWTLEISNDKQPPPTQILQYYSYNEPAMIAMIEYAGYGLKGTVTDATTGNPVPAWIVVNNSTMPTYTDPQKGDYHKYMIPGNYAVTAMANGYSTMTKNNIQVNDLSATTCNFALIPNGDHYAYRVAACQIPDNNFEDEGNTPGALGAPDDINYSIGKSGWVVLDMQQSILDGPGMEIRVHEGDDTPEGYLCYAGPTMDGPWFFLGNGNGSKSFDFGANNVLEAQFIRIVDDGTGIALEDNAGFDLDAVEILDQPQIVFLKVDCDIDDSEGNDNGRLDPGETADLVFSIRNHGGLTASNATANLNYDSSWVVVDNPNLDFGDLAHGDQAVVTVTITVDGETPLEEIWMTVLNITANEGNYSQSFPMHHMIGAIMEDFESANFDMFDWEFTNSPWVISPVNAYDGLWSAKSANIGNGQSSGLQITLDVIGYDDISFYRFVSSESGFDFLNFFIDGNLIDRWSGDTGWELVSYDVTPGEHTFTWTYTKDAGTSHGYDAGWVDNIKFPSFNLNGEFRVLANATPHGYCEPGESQLGAYLIGPGSGNTFAWTPETNISGVTSQFPTAFPDETTVYSVEVTNGANVAGSSIQVTVYGIPDAPVIEQQGDSLISSYENGNQWYNSEGIIEGANGQVYYPEEEDIFFAIHTSEYGCVSDTSNLLQFLWTGMDERQDDHLIYVFPNPAQHTMYISCATEADYDLTITDLAGRVIFDERSVSRQLKMINVQSWPRGVYLVHIRVGSETLISKKIIR